MNSKLESNYAGVKDLPFLSLEEEKALAEVIQGEFSEEKKQEAIATLINSNIKIAIHRAHVIAKKFNIQADELFGGAMHGLMTAAWKYNPEKFNTKFGTYALPWINQKIYRTLSSFSQVRVPQHITEQIIKMNKLSGNNISDAELISELGVSVEALKKIRWANQSKISLDASVDESDGACARDFIADDSAEAPYAQMEKQEDFAILYEALNDLDEMSKDIVSSQYLEEDKVKLNDLGAKYGISGERVRQIKKKALDVLKKKLYLQSQLA